MLRGRYPVCADNKPDQRARAFRGAPVETMMCLRHATALRRGHHNGSHSASVASQRCLQAFVVSDTQLVSQCAQRVIDGVRTSRGQAAMSNPVETASQNISHDKQIVDWWVLAQSMGIIRMEEWSSFTASAQLFREGGQRGWTLSLRSGWAERATLGSPAWNTWLQDCSLP